MEPSMRPSALPLFIGFVLLFPVLQLSQAQFLPPSPSPNPPTHDGSTIDQGVAYVLLLIALAITYLFH